jgi:arylsulfatase A-like enzyme
MNTRHNVLKLARLMIVGAVLFPMLGKSAESGFQALEKSKPNIVVVLADDLGYGDVQCYNPQRGKIPTPNVDRLAAQGIRFTDGHSSSGVCSPSRYALLTGRYHWRSRLQAGIVQYLEEPLIAPDRLTIAGLAKQHGYRTAAIGKWHLGWDWNLPKEQRELFEPPRKTVPTVTEAHRQAWQKVYAQPIAGGPTTRGFDEYFGTDVPNWAPYCFIKNDRTVGIPTEFLPAPLLAHSLASLSGPALKDWKLENILPTLGEQASEFITRQTKAGQPFLLYLPLTAPHTPIAVAPEWRNKSGLCTYADFVMEMDAIVGRVLDTLHKSGQADNTLVIFTSDNGCSPHGVKPSLEVGHFPSGPLRGYKASVYEGGHRVPFIVRWPAVTRAGSVCGQLVHQADIMATLADIFGAKLPDNAGEDSFSLLPLLKGGDKPTRPHAVSCASSGVPGLRRGDWKYILAATPELYNLADDIGETKNLATKHPERLAEMKMLLEKLITDGRSTPGALQKNDVEVRRFPENKPAPKAKPVRKQKVAG